MVKKFPDYHLVGEETRMVSLSTRVQVLFTSKEKLITIFIWNQTFNPVLFETKGVKVSSACGSRLPCVPCLPPLQLPQSPPRGRGGQWPLGQPSGGGGGKLWGPSLTCKTGLIKNIWLILTLCRRWGWTFTTRCFARTAATLSSTSSGRPFKSICSVNI